MYYYVASLGSVLAFCIAFEEPPHVYVIRSREKNNCDNKKKISTHRSLPLWLAQLSPSLPLICISPFVGLCAMCLVFFVVFILFETGETCIKVAIL